MPTRATRCLLAGLLLVVSACTSQAATTTTLVATTATITTLAASTTTLAATTTTITTLATTTIESVCETHGRAFAEAQIALLELAFDVARMDLTNPRSFADKARLLADKAAQASAALQPVIVARVEGIEAAADHFDFELSEYAAGFEAAADAVDKDDSAALDSAVNRIRSTSEVFDFDVAGEALAWLASNCPGLYQEVADVMVRLASTGS
ncbi:MAG TPA: hypothetical protein VJA44_06230 [Acidimicrobiia bacterium]|nr:hypothetical protein [Acidimicrobiia bacterium]